MKNTMMRFMAVTARLLAVVLLAALLAALLAGCGTKPGALVGPETAYRMVQRGDALFLDVRSADEYEEAHIADAISLPFYDITDAELTRIAAMGRTVITYCSCPAEETSIAAASEFIQAGFDNVAVLKGGIQDWAVEGYPVRAGMRP
jgi:rhodanese-related sulfurtransferase